MYEDQFGEFVCGYWGLMGKADEENDNDDDGRKCEEGKDEK